MRYVVYSVLLLLIISCDFVKKKVNANDIVEEEMQTFNWNEVDAYPSFSSCDSIAKKSSRKQCFETALSSHILRRLKTHPIVVTKVIKDTVFIHVLIDKKGKISLTKINTTANIKAQIPQLDSLIIKSFDSLPKLFPAIKRGQQVDSKYKLPLIIQAH